MSVNYELKANWLAIKSGTKLKWKEDESGTETGKQLVSKERMRRGAVEKRKWVIKEKEEDRNQAWAYKQAPWYGEYLLDII